MKQQRKVEPQDGGWGWCVVFGVFVSSGLTYGALVTYPLFFMPLMAEFDVGIGQVTWLTGCFDLGKALGHLAASPLCDKFGYRPVSFGLSVATSLSLSCAYFSSASLTVYLLCGLVPGFSLGVFGAIFFVVIVRYFDERRNLALGLSQSGSAVGTLALAPLFQFFIDLYTWKGALLIFGGLSLNNAVASTLYRPVRLKSDEVEKAKGFRQSLKAMRSVMAFTKFWVICLAFTAVYTGWRIHLTFLVPFAQKSLGVDPIMSSTLLSIYSFVSIFSRIFFGVIGDIKSMNVTALLMISIALTGTTSASMWLVSNYTGLVLTTVAHSLTSGSFHFLYVPLMIDAAGLNNLQWTYGMSAFSTSVCYAFTVPMVGLLLQVNGEMRWAFVIASALMFGATLLHFPFLEKKKIKPTSRTKRNAVNQENVVKNEIP